MKDADGNEFEFVCTKGDPNADVSVRVNGRITGTIKKVEGGWQYVPRGQRRGGGRPAQCRRRTEAIDRSDLMMKYGVPLSPPQKDWKDIEWCRDHAGSKFKVGDRVVVLTPTRITESGGKIIVQKGAMRVANVLKMQYCPGTGFAQVGDSCRIIVEISGPNIPDEERIGCVEGDTENGYGGAIFKLA